MRAVSVCLAYPLTMAATAPVLSIQWMTFRSRSSAGSSPVDLDLFDRVNEHDEFDSSGIGDKQPKVYANLSCNDRMRLGVLKVRRPPLRCLTV